MIATIGRRESISGWKDGPKIVVNVDTTQLDEAIAKVQKLLDMLYEADNLAPGILRSGEVNND